MLLRRAHRRFTAWLAMLAVLLSALAPTLAHAVVAASDGPRWVQVCSASGMVWVKLETHPGQADPQRSGHSAPSSEAAAQCPWCNPHGGAAGLPVSAVATPPVSRRAEPAPAFISAATLSGVWSVAQARAPPLAT